MDIAPKSLRMNVCDGAPDDVTRLHNMNEFVKSQLTLVELNIVTHVLRMGSKFIAKIFCGNVTSLLYCQLKDEFYIGLRQKCATGQEYVELLHEFMSAVKQNYGEEVLIQGVSKGVVAEKILFSLVEGGRQAEFVLCIGDDRSDEDMFEGLAGVKTKDLVDAHTEVFACTVG